MKLPESGTVSQMTGGWLSPSLNSRDGSMHGTVTFLDALHAKFRLCFASAVTFELPCTPFA